MRRIRFIFDCFLFLKMSKPGPLRWGIFKVNCNQSAGRPCLFFSPEQITQPPRSNHNSSLLALSDAGLNSDVSDVLGFPGRSHYLDRVLRVLLVIPARSMAMQKAPSLSRFQVLEPSLESCRPATNSFDSIYFRHQALKGSKLHAFGGRFYVFYKPNLVPRRSTHRWGRTQRKLTKISESQRKRTNINDRA